MEDSFDFMSPDVKDINLMDDQKKAIIQVL